MIKQLNILVGGPTANWPAALAQKQIAGPWIGADRGALRLLDLGIQPLAAIGDFDSMAPAEYQRVKTALAGSLVIKPDQDQTDTELAIATAFQQYQAEKVTVYGATGGRLDHFLANLLLVLAPRFRALAPQIQLIDRQNVIRFYLPGTYQLTKLPASRYLAFVPLTPMTLTLPDEKYQLKQQAIPYPISYASNEFVGQEGHFDFDAGVLAVIQSWD